jgi:hypothetical protein
MFGGGYPITSLKRDDPRTVRFLQMLSCAYRLGDRHWRALEVTNGRGDPGPTFMEQLAAQLDQIKALYEARAYGDANTMQSSLANRVVRLGKDPAVPASQRPTIESQLMTVWKACWKNAADQDVTTLVLAHNLAAMDDANNVINSNRPGRTDEERKRDELLAVKEQGKTFSATMKLGPERQAAVRGIEDGAKDAQAFFDTHPDRLAWAAKMVRDDHSLEMVKTIFPEPNSRAVIDRAAFAREADWQAACNLYGWAYALAVSKLALERERRLAARS